MEVEVAIAVTTATTAVAVTIATIVAAMTPKLATVDDGGDGTDAGINHDAGASTGRM